jgi:glucose/arabinose dehydrogenase
MCGYCAVPRKRALLVTSAQVIIDKIPRRLFTRLRIKFGPDGKLYVTTGRCNGSHLRPTIETASRQKKTCAYR